VAGVDLSGVGLFPVFHSIPVIRSNAVSEAQIISDMYMYCTKIRAKPEVINLVSWLS